MPIELGVYSSNTTIDISDYNVASVDQFIIVPLAGEGHKFQEYRDWHDPIWGAKYIEPSLSINENILTINAPVLWYAVGNLGQWYWYEGQITLKYKVYFCV